MHGLFLCLFLSHRLPTTFLADSIFAVGKPQSATLNCEEAIAIQKLLDTIGIEGSASDTAVTIYSKMINKKLVYSRQARRVKKRNNVTIAFTDPQMPS